MKVKIIVASLLFTAGFMVQGQTTKQPVQLNLKSGESVDAIHFGQLKCGKEIYGDNYIILKGKYMNAVTEIRDFRDIEKIILVGYKEAPTASLGNEKGKLNIIKKNGVEVTMDDAEIVMSCYSTGDNYNTLIVQILNPLSNQPSEFTVETRNLHSIIFK